MIFFKTLTSALNISSQLATLLVASTLISFINAKAILPTTTDQHDLHASSTSTSRIYERTELTSTITPATVPTPTSKNQDFSLGSCLWAIGRTCPDKDIAFVLYTRRNSKEGQHIHFDVVGNETSSNLSRSSYDKRHPSKIVIHGYNADMFLHALQSIKDEYLALGEYNVFYVDWSKLAMGLCYLNAVHNIRHTGACVAQLVTAITELGNDDIHVIGFSLGAQLANYIAKNLGTYRLPRITGLDPALPLFITSSNDEKLDASDAQYVDVMHTNALVQGKFEQCGDSDVYMNGGIFQPNCIDENTYNPFACFHHRAIEYFVESIRSEIGFWAWPCSSYFAYILGLCQPTDNLVEVGANIKTTTKGMFIVYTNGKPPYALGKWTTSSKSSVNISSADLISITESSKSAESLLPRLEKYSKLHYEFNNLASEKPTPYSQDPYGENWTYFSEETSGITNDLTGRSV